MVEPRDRATFRDQALLLIPADEPVTGAEVEYRVGQREDADQLAVGPIPDKEPVPATVTLGHWDAPVQGREPEQVGIKLAGPPAALVGPTDEPPPPHEADADG